MPTSSPRTSRRTPPRSARPGPTTMLAGMIEPGEAAVADREQHVLHALLAEVEVRPVRALLLATRCCRALGGGRAERVTAAAALVEQDRALVHRARAAGRCRHLIFLRAARGDRRARRRPRRRRPRAASGGTRARILVTARQDRGAARRNSIRPGGGRRRPAHRERFADGRPHRRRLRPPPGQPKSAGLGLQPLAETQFGPRR